MHVHITLSQLHTFANHLYNVSTFVFLEKTKMHHTKWLGTYYVLAECFVWWDALETIMLE